MRKYLTYMIGAGLLFTSQPARAEHRLFKASLGILAAGTAADAATSWGKMEGTPWLRDARGRFGARGLAIKGGIAGGVALGTWLIHRRHPGADRPLAVVNFAVGGSALALAVHNHGVRR